jgi:WD40 repeat protein
LEEGLAPAIVADVADQPGALPLLQYALTELFERRQDHQMTRAAYQDIGGVLGALGRRAEEIYTNLDQNGQAVSRQLFLRLVTLGEGVEDTRRRVLRSELVAVETSGVSETPEVFSAVIDHFGGARLLTFDHDPVTRGPTVEVAHEALLREWGRLRSWLDESRNDVRMQRMLASAEVEWAKASEDPGFLLRGARLDQFTGWATSSSVALTQSERAFLDASVTARESRQAEEEARRQHELETAQKLAETEHARAEEQANSAGRLRRRAMLLAGISLVAVLMAIFAFAAQATARREAAVNRSLVLAGQAIEADEAGEVDLALALAMEAVNIDEPPLNAVSKLANVANGMGTRTIFTGHNGAVQAGAFSPDGRQAISGGCVQADDAGICHSGELILWDLAAKKEMVRWPGHDAWVSALAWSPSGKEILSGGGDGSLVLWDAANQEILAQWDAHDAAINALAISPDGTLAAAASDDGTLTLLDLANRQINHHLEGHSGPILDVAFSPDGKHLLSGSADATMILWDVTTGEPLRTFTGHRSSIRGVAFLPDGLRILSASGDLTFRLWDTTTGAELQKRESGDQPNGMALGPDGHTVLHRVDHVIYIWDLEQWNAPHQKLLGHVGVIRDVAVSADGRLALSAGDDGTVRIWNLHGEGDLQQTNIGLLVTGVAVAPDGKALAIGAWGGDSMIWDLAKGQPTLDLTGGVGIAGPGSVAYSPDGRWVVIGSGDYDHDTEAGSLLVWEAATGEIHCDLQGHDRRLRTVAFSPDSRYVLSGSQGADEMGTIILWDVNNCQLVRRFATEQDTTGIDFSDDGRYAVTASAFSANVTMWDVVTGQAVQVFSLPGDVLLDTTFGPDDETVLAATLSGLIMQWDRVTGEEIRRFAGHDGGVWSVSLSPEEQKLISSDDTGTIILWDMATGAELRRHNAHNALSFQAAFSPDGQTVYSVSADETLVVWQVGDPSLSALLSWIQDNRYVRQLTCAEREQYDVAPLCD